MNIILVFLNICLAIQLATAPPPRNVQSRNSHSQDVSSEKNEVDEFDLEYNRYLKEVINLLESDPEFKKKLEEAHEVDIRSGVIAKELEFVDHKVRTKLDEVKRQEIERLRHLAQKQYELNNGLDLEHAKVSSEHLDHANPHTFEAEDLKKLIAKVSSDLSEADEKRRREFKEYEMQKEFEKQQKLKHLEGSEREAFEKQLKENETKHKQHERLHEPGSKQQLEEVWEKQDHMENQEFDPKVFFQLHDLDGNGFWDHNEVKALFLKELDKMYEAGAPEDDMKERVEEMERMREHVFKETDKNKDGLISLEEFLETTKQPDFEKDPGWESLDQKPVYTHEEYLEFERQRQKEIQRMIDQGLIPQQPVFHDPYNGQGHYVQYKHQQAANYPAVNLNAQKDYRYANNFQNSIQQPAYVHHQQIPDHLSQNQQYQLHNQGQMRVETHPSEKLQHQQIYNQVPEQIQQKNQHVSQQTLQANHHDAEQAHQINQQLHLNQVQQNFQQQKNHLPTNTSQPLQDRTNNLPQGQPINPKHPDAQYYQTGFDGKALNTNQGLNTNQLNLKYSKTQGNDNHQNTLNSQYKSKEQNYGKQSQV